MKTDRQMTNILSRLTKIGTKFPKYTYEDGVNDTILWFLGELSDSEFKKILSGGSDGE